VTARRRRDDYAEVGAATRVAIERAIATAEGHELSRYMRVFLAVLHETSSWSRLSDSVFRARLTELAAIAGDLDGKHTAEMLHRLAERGVIVWSPSRVNGRPSLVGLPGSAPVQPPLLGSVKGGQLDGKRGANFDDFSAEVGPPSEKVPRRTEGIAIANFQDRPCEVCGRVSLFGYPQATLWYCERHRQDSASV